MSTRPSKILVVVLIVSLALNIGVVSMVLVRHAGAKRMFQRGPGFGMMRPSLHPFYKKLGITKEQEKEIAKIQEETEKANSPIFKEMREQRNKLFKMLKEGKIDDAQKEGIIRKISGLQAQSEEIIIDSMIKTRAIMTPEQLEKMDKTLGKFEKSFLRPFPSDSGPMMHGPIRKGGWHTDEQGSRLHHSGK